MKKLTRIFVAVAVLFAGFACTTDATNDLGVQLNGVGQTTLTFSLEESRTVLGAEVNGLYPVAWCADDAISVNGVKSTSIAISDNASVATFAFDGVLNYPYCVAYPATAEGKVVFADQQSYTEGTFADGAAVMYGYAETEGGMTLKHLTGVLKIGVVGDKTLTYAQISNVNRAPIAGEFALDFAEGVVTPTTSSKELINYSFGEGVELSSTPTYLHVAVPAGVYGELYVTLYDTEGGVMYATVKANDEKPLKAGKVREFTNNITYVANASVFVIKDVATLKAFAEQAAELDKDVLFVSDVDMTGEAWTPIEGYSNTVLGNGFAIKGLTAPLFGTTSASIKGLHLKDVNIVTNDAPVAGALVCTATASNTTAPVIENCSVSGAFTVENPTYVPAAKDSYTLLNYGAVVGYSIGVPIKNCVNNATFTIKQSIASTCTTSSVDFAGGIVGEITAYTNTDDATVVKYANIDGCINRGAIIVNDTTQPEGAGMVSYWMGGVVGHVSKANLVGGYIANCKNDAPITITEINNFATQYTQLGGIVGHVQYLENNLYEISDCENTANGDITVSGRGNHMYLGGISGYNYNCAHTNLVNRGDINVSAIFDTNLFVAGCLASPGLHDSDAKHNYTGDNINNYGKINVTGAGSTFYVAGVFGRSSQGVVSNSSNYGSVTIKPSDASKIGSMILGGFEATGVGDGDAGSLTNCHNYAPVYIEINGATAVKQFLSGAFSAYSHRKWTDCSNSKEGTLTIKGSMNLISNNVIEDTTTDSHYAIGAMGGYRATQANVNSVNYADVTIDVDWTTNTEVTPFLQIGGYIGRTHQNIADPNRSYGNLKVGGSSDNSTITMAIGGLAGSNIYTSSNWNNDCNVYVSGNHYNLYVGGCLGYSHGYKGAPMTGAVNNAKVYVGVDEKGNAASTTITLGPKIGGVIGYTLSAMTDCTNNGEVRYNANRPSTSSLTLHIGGVLGYAQAEGSKACATTLTRVTNNGSVSLEGDQGEREIYAGGINGYMYGKGTQTGLVNNGALTLNMASNCTGHFKIGGISGGIRNAIDNCENNGPITIKGTVGKTLYIAGIVANANGYHRTNLYSNGDVYIDAKIKYDCFFGGISYDAANGNIRFENCHNTANVTLTKNTTVGNALGIGGIVGKYTTVGEQKRFIGCSNSGNFSCAATSEGTTNMGGFMGYSNNATIIIEDGFTNSGNITHTGLAKGADQVQIGGLFGNASGVVMTYDTTTTVDDVTTTVSRVWTGKIVNTGKLTLAGRSEGGNLRVGGLFGLLTKDLPESATYHNFGDIEYAGDPGSKNGTPGNSYAGGLVGYASANCIIPNGEVYCTISALTAKNCGFVVGTPYSDIVKALNCKVGGTLLGEYDEEDEEYKTTTLDASNYFNYIYSTPVEQSVAEADGCSVLTAKPIQ